MAKALVVDDHAIFRKMVTNMVKDSFEIIEATNGEEGLAVVQAHIGEIKIILSDVNMPKMDGLTMAERVRQIDGGADIPIIFLTSERDAEMMARAEAVGAVSWVPKPFKKDQLQAAIGKIS